MKKFVFFMLGMLLLCMQLLAQSRAVTGRITDAQGNPVPNVSVTVKGTSVGTTTAADGSFTLNVPDNARTLSVSSVGYEVKEVALGNESNFTISLTNAEKAMDEVVVVAYGTAKKGTFTGSASQIDAKKIEQRPITNVSNALTGAAPGIQTNAASGQPGAGPSIRIRGFGSINASNEPLYVVDGVRYSGSIANLNPGDIESISVLKDAASSSLYGSEAANGVILITTKKGKKGRNQVDVKVAQGITSRGIKEYDRVNAQQYYPLMWEAYRNSLAYAATPVAMDDANKIATGLMPRIATGTNAGLQSFNGKAYYDIRQLLGYNPFNVGNTEIVGTDGQLNPNAQLLYANDLDWYAPLERTGTRSDYSVGFNGGADKSDYFVSLGYVNEKGFVKKSDYERITGRLNLNTQPLSWFRSGLNLSGTVTQSNQANDGSSTGYVNPFFFSRNMGPIYPVYAHNPTTGEYLYDRNGERIYDLGNLSGLGLPNRASGASVGRHVVAETMYNDNLFKRNVLSGRTFGEISFLKAFKFTSNISVDISNYNASTYDNKIVGDGAPAGRAGKTATTTTSYTFNQLLNYSKSFDRHNVEALLGHENYDYTYNYTYGFRQGQIVDGNTELVNFTTTNDLTSLTNKLKKEGYFSRVNYGYADKYLLSASYRMDGSSRFHKDVRWGDFWSVGAGWRLDKEAFFNVPVVNMLKLKASYGSVGNDAISSYYGYQALYGLGYNNAFEPGFLQEKLATNDLLWESNENFDAGVDFALFKNRLTGSAEFFHRQSSNLLFEVPLPLSSGILSRFQNIGKMWNRGVEVQVSGDVVRNNNFNWNATVNWTTVENQLTKLPQEEIISGTKKLMVGHSIYDYWLRDWYGVDPKDGAALYVAAPGTTSNIRLSKDGDTLTTSQNSAKYIYAGSAIPDFYGSVNNTVSYKGISLSVLVTYQVGGKIYDATYASLMHAGTYGTALHKDILNRWQKPGDETDVPRMDNAQLSAFGAQSDRWLTDASFLNINAANLSYVLPSKYASQLHVQNARIYLSGENLQLFSKRQGMNVTQAFSGVTSNAYLPARVVTLGLNVTL